LVILVGIRFYFTTFLMIVAISIIYNEFVRKPDLETKLSDSEKKDIRKITFSSWLYKGLLSGKEVIDEPPLIFMGIK